MNSNACLLECDENFPSSDCHSNSLSIFNTGRHRYGDLFALHLQSSPHITQISHQNGWFNRLSSSKFNTLTLCPLPSHSVHGYLLYWPVPAQYRHVERIINGPVETVSMPDPLQYWHFDGLVPNSQREPWHFMHVSTTFTTISLLTPRAAWANVKFIVTSCAAPNPNFVSAKSKSL